MSLKLIAKEHLTDNIWSFRFQPSEPLSWIAGQYVSVELPHDNPDAEGIKRWFTISSAPYEGLLRITTRITNTTFKQALAALEEGDTKLQLVDSPDGDFVWQESTLPVIYIAGGIGITPFYSILKQRLHDQLPLNATLIYGGRSENLAFKEELTNWAAGDSSFKIKYLIGEPLTSVKLEELESKIKQSLVYLSGPEPMVEALGNELKADGLPEAQLKQDFFPNYSDQNY